MSADEYRQRYGGRRRLPPMSCTPAPGRPTLATALPGLAPEPTVRPHKYNAQPTEVNGIRFPSKREAKRYEALCALRAAGEVEWFIRQPAFDLPGGVRYRADFLVKWASGRVSIEDAKGVRTEVYRVKKRQVEALYGIAIEEV